MKNSIIFLVTFLLLSCANNDPETISFELSQSSFTINKPQQTLMVNISTNSSWQAIDIPSWMTLDQTQGNGSYDLQIVVSQNNNYDIQPRTGVVKFISDNKVYLLTIVQTTIIVPTITILNYADQYLDYNQHVFTVQVSSTKPWFIHSKSAWVQLNPISGNAGVTSVEVTVLENTTALNRPGSATLTTETTLSAGNYKTIGIAQTVNPVNPAYAKTWVKTNSQDIITETYTELKNNKVNNTIFFAYTATNYSVIKSYNGFSWNVLTGPYGVYGIAKPKLAISDSGVPYTSFLKVGPIPQSGYAGAAICSDLNSGGTNSVISPSTASGTDIALTSNNDMVVVYNDNSNNGKITVKQKIGSSWQVIGNEGFSVGTVSFSNIAINSNDEIYVSYSDEGLGNKIVVKKYNGTSWETVGQLGFSNAGVEKIEMEIGSNNDIFVAYKDLGNGGKITVKKYNGTNWETIGGDGFSDFSVYSVSLALNNQNIPYIAYIENTNNYNPVIKKLDGSTWVDLYKVKLQDGGAFITEAYVLKLIIGSDNIPFIAIESGCCDGMILAKYLF